MVITGSRSHDLGSPEWLVAASLVKAGGTVIVLMGLSRLGEIADRLVGNECAGTTPVAVISKGTYLIQDCRVGTLYDIGNKARGMKAPAIIVIGEVVSLRNQIQWMELAGKFGIE
jgi:siroheme synthase